MKINKAWINKQIELTIENKNYLIAKFGIDLLNKEVMLNELKCK